MICSKCNSSNEISTVLCLNCGNPLSQPVNLEMPSNTGTGSVDDAANYYSAIIGPKNTAYYLSKFLLSDSNGRAGVSWHWPAFFVTLYWLLHRKMWLNAFIYFLAPNLVLIALGLVGGIAGNSAEAVIGVGWLLFVTAVLLLPPLYANALYHTHCKKKVAKIRASRLGEMQQLEELSRKGGTSNIVLILVSIFAFIFVVGTLAAVAIPAFQDYKTKARMVGIVLFGNAATDSVAAYYKQNQRMPNTLEEAGFILSLPQDIKGARVNSENGMVIITMAIEPMSGKSLIFVPSLDSIEKIEWTCMSQEIPDRYLPQQCWRKK